MKKELNFIFNIPANFALGLIGFYQKTLSPDHGFLRGRFPHGYCRYYPSCSEYAKEAIARFGLVKGGFLAFARILRCHPWAEPKIDKVPNT